MVPPPAATLAASLCGVEQAFVRKLMRIVVLGLLFTGYYFAWNSYDLVIFGITGGSCLGTCAGVLWLLPSCGAGLVATLLHGIRIGAHYFDIDFHLKLF